jgi:hypothetical protein
MADEVAKLLLQIDASTALMKTNLIAAERQIADFQRGTNSKLAAVDRQFDQTGKGVGRLESSFTSAKVAAGAFIAAAGAGAAAVLFDATRAALQYGSSLGEVADQLGVTTDDLQTYRFVASQVGIEQGEMDKALQRLTRTLGDAGNGNKKASAAFNQLGVSLRNADGSAKSAGQALPEIVDALARLPDPAARATIELALFGKAGQQLEPLVKAGSSAIRSLYQEFEASGGKLTPDDIQKLDNLADSIEALKQKAQGNLAKLLAQNSAEIDQLAKSANDAIEDITPFIQSLISMRDEVGKPIPYNQQNFFQKFATDLNTLQRQLNDGGAAINRFFTGKKSAFEQTSYAIPNFTKPGTAQEFTQPSRGPKPLPPPAPGPARAGPTSVGKPLKGGAGLFGVGGAAGLSGINFDLILPQLEAAAARFDAIKAATAPIRGDIERIATSQGQWTGAASDLIDSYKREQAIALLRAEGRDREADRIVEIARLSEEINRIEKLSGPQKGELLILLSQMADEAERQRDAVAEELGFRDGIAANITASVTESMQPILDTVNEDLDRYRQRRLDIEDELAGKFETLFQGGFKALWKDFERQGLQALARLAAQAVANGLFGGGDGGGGFGDFLGGLLGGGGSGGGFGSVFFPGREGGGAVTAGQPYIVGEKRPEIFVPRLSGNIIPRVGAGGGSNVSINIDARGAVEGTAAQIEAAIARAAPLIIQAAEGRTIDTLTRDRL